MTYTKLIERLRDNTARHDDESRRLCNEAADAIEALQSKLGDAIQSSAHWQHQFTEAQDQAKLDLLTSALSRVVAPEALTEGYIQRVPDKCDRILWRDKYYHLPIAAPKALAPRFTECRIELVNAIHTLASHYENRVGRFDPEDRKLADGDIAHAMATAAKWNWNGNGIGGTP